MKKIIALTFLAISMTACPQKAPKAVAEKAPAVVPPAAVKPVVKKMKEVPITKKLAALGQKKTYSITYPKGWELKPKFMGTDTMALSQPEGASDTFRENMNVVIEPVQIKDKKAYYEANLRTMKAQMKGFKLISSTDIKLSSGIQATDLIYLHGMGGINAKNRAVFMYENRSGYVITATAKPSTFKKFNPQFEKVIQSFKLN